MIQYNRRVNLRIAERVEECGQTRLLFYPTDERFLGERVFLSPPRRLSPLSLFSLTCSGAGEGGTGMSCILIPSRKEEGRFNSLQPAIHASLPLPSPPFPSVHFCASKQGSIPFICLSLPHQRHFRLDCGNVPTSAVGYSSTRVRYSCCTNTVPVDDIQRLRSHRHKFISGYPNVVICLHHFGAPSLRID